MGKNKVIDMEIEFDEDSFKQLKKLVALSGLNCHEDITKMADKMYNKLIEFETLHYNCLIYDKETYIKTFKEDIKQLTKKRDALIQYDKHIEINNRPTEVLKDDERVEDLEKMAFMSLCGDEIERLLRVIDPKLEKEYMKLMQEEHGR